MSIFARLKNLFVGFASLFVSDIEKANPEIAYENSINSLVEKYGQLKKATASIIRRRTEIATRLNAERKSLTEISADLEAAIDNENDDLATLCIEKQEALKLSIAELEEEEAVAKQDAEDAKSGLQSVQSEIQKLKTEKDRMLAKLKSAEARVKIQESLDGLSIDAEVRALDGVREHINNTAAEARLNKELQETDLDAKLKKLRQGSGSVAAKRKLEEMKAERLKVKQNSAELEELVERSVPRAVRK